jgi:hypothetical protein
MQRLESSAVGRVLISVLVVLVLGAFVSISLPVSVLKQDLLEVTQPFINATGLDQNWQVFVTPRQTSAYVYARVTYADGGSSEVDIPNGTGLAAYVDYRWQKYEEQVRPDSGRELWATYAAYVAHHAADGGRTPVRISLVRRWADTTPPGPGPERTSWQEYTFFTTTTAVSPS